MDLITSILLKEIDGEDLNHLTLMLLKKSLTCKIDSEIYKFKRMGVNEPRTYNCEICKFANNETDGCDLSEIRPYFPCFQQLYKNFWSSGRFAYLCC